MSTSELRLMVALEDGACHRVGMTSWCGGASGLTLMQHGVRLFLTYVPYVRHYVRTYVELSTYVLIFTICSAQVGCAIVRHCARRMDAHFGDTPDVASKSPSPPTPSPSPSPPSWKTANRSPNGPLHRLCWVPRGLDRRLFAGPAYVRTDPTARTQCSDEFDHHIIIIRTYDHHT